MVVRDAERPLLINLGTTGLTGTPGPWAARVDYIDARLACGESGGQWHLPVFGDMPAVDAVLVRPDGYVAWVHPVAEPLDHHALTDALTRWPGVARSALPELI
ncbi:hypothetical protein AB0L63_01870 [Nocardia sp. NPDC051990]|uniref:aromatic-ring hydroxylase C-terminal domain-containing protein n=1 Tax=Nocardia sp. NPDC051990 TaxID=3155285 RepID=UPI00342037CC